MASGILLVACHRSGTFSTGVVAAGAARPEVVVRGAAGGLDACSAELLSEVGDGNMKLYEVLQGDEELGVGGNAVCSEFAAGRSDIRVSGLHSLFVGQYHIDAVLGGDFVNAGYV